MSGMAPVALEGVLSRLRASHWHTGRTLAQGCLGQITGAQEVARLQEVGDLGGERWLHRPNKAVSRHRWAWMKVKRRLRCTGSQVRACKVRTLDGFKLPLLMGTGQRHSATPAKRLAQVTGALPDGHQQG